MNPAVEQRWKDAERSIKADVTGCETVRCLIPGWEPVDLAMGLHWVQSSIYEGFYLRHQTAIKDAVATVRLKIWEYGEEEPDFPPRQL